jgi:hypothetical protein
LLREEGDHTAWRNLKGTQKTVVPDAPFKKI